MDLPSPSVQSIGKHGGGALWVADRFVVDGVDGKATAMTATQSTKGCIVRGGGGEGTLTCRNHWALFNGNAEHETQPYTVLAGEKKATRISFIAFSNSSYNKLMPSVANELRSLGFTAASSDGVDMPFFQVGEIG